VDDRLLFDRELQLYIAAIKKYSFAQADEILPKINVFKQHYLCKRNLFTMQVIQRRSCYVAYSSIQ